MAWFLILFAIAFFASFGWWCLKFYRCLKPYAKYNGPTPLPMIGNLHQFSSVVDVIPVIMDMHKRYGLVMKLWFGYQPRLVISDCRAAELVLGSTTLLEKSAEYNYLLPWLGTGLLISSGSKWKQQRKLLTPAFHFKILEQFNGVLHSQTDTLIEVLAPMANGETFDIYPFINLCALDLICEATMGTKVNAQKDSESKYVRSVKEMCRIFGERTISFLKMFDCTYQFTGDFSKEQKAISVLHGHSYAVIKSRQKELSEETQNETNYEENYGIKNRMAFLDLLLRSKVDGNLLSMDVIRQEVDTFMFEGHDTTTAGLCFTLYCISIHPQVQDKIVEELRAIFGNDQRSAPTSQNLQEMKYLEMVIKESLRLYPPVPFFARKVVDEVEFDGTTLPRNSTIVIFPYGVHRQEEMYADPEKFDPERFTLENSSKRSPYSFVPFSAGPRNCIGQRFAMMEMKSVIAKIIRRYEILPAPGYKPILSLEVTLRSSNGILVRLKTR